MLEATPVIVVGAGGHALVSIEILRAAGYTVRGCAAAHVSAPDGLARFSIPLLGTDDELHEVVDKGGRTFVAIGANDARRRLIEVVLKLGTTLVEAVSSSAVVSDSASIGPGSLVGPGAVVNTLTTIGLGGIVNSGAIVEHECVLRDFAHVAPGAILAGRVSVGEGAVIGVGAHVLPGRQVGQWATVGAGSVVVDDVPDGTTVVGAPARQVSPRRDRA